MLVSALMGIDVMKAAYAHAIDAGSLLLLRRRQPLAALLGPRLDHHIERRLGRAADAGEAGLVQYCAEALLSRLSA